MMKLAADDLILFARVIEAGSFSKAAERCGLPKSTVSRRIGVLERRLGERLLTRTTRQLAITEFGERILDHARRLLEEAEAASALADSMPSMSQPASQSGAVIDSSRVRRRMGGSSLAGAWQGCPRYRPAVPPP